MHSFPICIYIAFIPVERSRSVLQAFWLSCAHGRLRLPAAPHRSHCAGAPSPRARAATLTDGW
eukprot:1228009-Pleurochrysis_carterae.AAC.1